MPGISSSPLFSHFLWRLCWWPKLRKVVLFVGRNSRAPLIKLCHLGQAFFYSHSITPIYLVLPIFWNKRLFHEKLFLLPGRIFCIRFILFSWIIFISVSFCYFWMVRVWVISHLITPLPDVAFRQPTGCISAKGFFMGYIGSLFCYF